MVKPFVKWAGGKSKLIPKYAGYFPALDEVERYFEPMVGGGAMLFWLGHSNNVISDANYELINTYQVVAYSVEELIDRLQFYPHDKALYYSIRALNVDDCDSVGRAVRFIYLNKTCYNGLYRVNRKGGFNVPFGKYKNPNICDCKTLREASAFLSSSTSINHCDFETTLADCRNGDFVYIDPPYLPISTAGNFTDYTKGGFGIEDHERLAACVKRIAANGAKVMVSNSSCDIIRSMYSDFNVFTIPAKRNINRDGNKRGAIDEVVITTYDIGENTCL